MSLEHITTEPESLCFKSGGAIYWTTSDADVYTNDGVLVGNLARMDMMMDDAPIIIGGNL